jgi:hypothetical protein
MVTGHFVRVDNSSFVDNVVIAQQTQPIVLAAGMLL